MHQISFWWGITPESEITRTKKKKTCVNYFSMRNPYMKFQNPSMHGFWRTDTRTHNPKLICLSLKTGRGGHLGHVTQTLRTNFHSPNPWMLHMKFGFDWPSYFGDLWKWWTDDGPWLYHKLTNEPKGSGESKRRQVRPCELLPDITHMCFVQSARTQSHPTWLNIWLIPTYYFSCNTGSGRRGPGRPSW